MYTAHVWTKATKNEFADRPIERMHNEIREKLSARRGLRNGKSVQFYDVISNPSQPSTHPYGFGWQNTCRMCRNWSRFGI